ncbi:MAG: adenylyltransferase/cytidyltransferase family protein [Candidatus Andersenbacteria bacterium]|nr:adenylyltransferase/cytidyltransferase family protein [Candidatus Andersenbacteria bacterium]
MHHWRTEKILSTDEAATKAAELKTSGKKIVTVNGAFDILHAGHLDMLEEAKMQGDALFVGVNSDTSIRDKKGADRPYISQEERMAMLAALICVDYVVLLDAPYDQAQDALILAVKPDVHANGAEYGPVETWVDYPAMQKVGAKGYGVERRPGLATSDIVKKVKEA